jgi:hypothetical protein
LAARHRQEVAVAKIYVSYRSSEEPFIRDVLARLDRSHDIRIDYKMPTGVDWRAQQLEDLRASDVFVVFVSKDTRASDFQNAEMGSARFCQVYLDGKTMIPALIDRVDPPRPLANLDYLDLSHRDPARAAQQIEAELANRRRQIRLFISHAHRDQDVAKQLVDVISGNLVVPADELRCTSVPGYQLDLGAQAQEDLRRELGSAACVIALLTPNSVGNDWVAFELGAAWANTKVSIPLLAGGLQDKDIPGPLRGAAGGQLTHPETLDRMLEQLKRLLGWSEISGAIAQSKRHDFVRYVASKTFADNQANDDLRAGFAAKLARIGARQGLLLDYVARRSQGRRYLSLDDLNGKVDGIGNGNELYYRLEQLRLLGFLDRSEQGDVDGQPSFGWTLSERYRNEIGR